MISARHRPREHGSEWQMNLRQLKYFIGVVEAGNMTRAA